MTKVRVAALAVIALMATGAAGAAATAAPAPGSIVIQRENLGELGVRWWKWALSIPYAQNPMLDTTGAHCAVDQSGGTWFLAGMPTGGTVTRSCTVPAGMRVFFPIVNVENDYPCPDPSFHPAPGQSLKDFLTNGTGSIPGAVTLINQASNLQASVDGLNIPIGSSYRGTSNMYSFVGDLSLTPFDPCITGSQQKAVSDGYWLMLEPLSPGPHVLQFGATLFGNTQTVTYNLTVQ